MQSLSLFHTLGKLLYKKDPSEPRYPPEEIIHRSGLQPSWISLFLHENYLNFFSEIEESSNAADDFSALDNIKSPSNFNLGDAYYESIIPRSLIINNENPAPRKFYQFVKPKLIQTERKATENFNFTLQAWYSQYDETDLRLPGIISSRSLMTEYVPYVAKMERSHLSSQFYVQSQKMSQLARSFAVSKQDVLPDSKKIEAEGLEDKEDPIIDF